MEVTSGYDHLKLFTLTRRIIIGLAVLGSSLLTMYVRCNGVGPRYDTDSPQDATVLGLVTPCSPVILMDAQTVCATLGVPRDFWKFCPSKTSSGRSIQSHLSGGAPSTAVTQAATTTNNLRGARKERPTFSPDKSPIVHLWLSFSAHTSAWTIVRLRPSWPPSTSPRRSWISSKDGGRSRLSRHKYAPGSLRSRPTVQGKS